MMIVKKSNRKPTLTIMHMCSGVEWQVCGCQQPNCDMGCLFANHTASLTACLAMCADASGKCEFSVQHLPIHANSSFIYAMSAHRRSEFSSHHSQMLFGMESHNRAYWVILY